MLFRLTQLFFIIRLKNTTIKRQIIMQYNVKQSSNRPGVAQTVPGGVGSKIS
jgi:hypothetical protein